MIPTKYCLKTFCELMQRAAVPSHMRPTGVDEPAHRLAAAVKAGEPEADVLLHAQALWAALETGDEKPMAEMVIPNDEPPLACLGQYVPMAKRWWVRLLVRLRLAGPE